MLRHWLWHESLTILGFLSYVTQSRHTSSAYAQQFVGHGSQGQDRPSAGNKYEEPSSRLISTQGLKISESASRESPKPLDAPAILQTWPRPVVPSERAPPPRPLRMTALLDQCNGHAQHNMLMLMHDSQVEVSQSEFQDASPEALETLGWTVVYNTGIIAVSGREENYPSSDEDESSRDRIGLFPSDLQPAFQHLGFSDSPFYNRLYKSTQNAPFSSYSPTDAQYWNNINTHNGIIVTRRNIPPRIAIGEFPYPGYVPTPLESFSDVTALQWEFHLQSGAPRHRDAPTPRLAYWIFHDIEDERTKNIIRAILDGEGIANIEDSTLPDFPGLEYDLPGNPYGMALLGSPEGFAVTETIATHRNFFRAKYKPSKVHLFKTFVRNYNKQLKLDRKGRPNQDISRTYYVNLAFALEAQELSSRAEPPPTPIVASIEDWRVPGDGNNADFGLFDPAEADDPNSGEDLAAYAAQEGSRVLQLLKAPDYDGNAETWGYAKNAIRTKGWHSVIDKTEEIPTALSVIFNRLGIPTTPSLNPFYTSVNLESQIEVGNAINIVSGVIITQINTHLLPPQGSERASHLQTFSEVTVRQWSDLVGYRLSVGRVPVLKWWFYYEVETEVTLELIDMLLGFSALETPGEWPGFEINSRTEEELIILGTPEGQNLARTIGKHRESFKYAYAPTKIHTWSTSATDADGIESRSTHLAFHLEKYVPPRPQEEHEAEAANAARGRRNREGTVSPERVEVTHNAAFPRRNPGSDGGSADTSDSNMSADFGSAIFREAARTADRYIDWLMHKVEIPQSVFRAFDDLRQNGWSTRETRIADLPRDIEDALDDLEAWQKASYTALFAADQDKTGSTQNGRPYRQTNAKYYNYIDPHGGVIVTQLNVPPDQALESESNAGSQPPPLHSFSDVTALQWRQSLRVLPMPKSGIWRPALLKYWVFHEVTNPTTLSIIAEIQATYPDIDDPGDWPGYRYDITQRDYFGRALLGSGEGLAVAETIASHYHLFDRKYHPETVILWASTITRSGAPIRVWNLAFELEAVDQPSARLKRAAAPPSPGSLEPSENLEPPEDLEPDDLTNPPSDSSDATIRPPAPLSPLGMTMIILEAMEKGEIYAQWLGGERSAPQSIFDLKEDLRQNGWSATINNDRRIPGDVVGAFMALDLDKSRSHNFQWLAHQDQSGDRNGVRFVRTDAEYVNFINLVSGVIVTTINRSPEDVRARYGLADNLPYAPPPLNKFSDVTALQWATARNKQKHSYTPEIRYWFFLDVEDFATFQIIEEILKLVDREYQGPGNWPGLAYSVVDGHEYGLALLGSPAGLALTETIAFHHKFFEYRSYAVVNVHIFGTGIVRNLAFELDSSSGQASTFE